MEPERNIEKDLKAYAERRRTEAGAPFELHPATRKMLRDEAARVWKSGAESVSDRRPFWSPWIRLAMSACAGVALLAIGVLFSNTGRKSRHETFMVASSQAPVEQPRDNRARSLASDSAAGEVEGMELRRSPNAPTPAPGMAENSRFANALSPSFSGAPLSRPKDQTPSLDMEKARNLRPAGVPTVVQRFTRSNVASVGGTADAIADSSMLLQSFRVEQSGKDLRMIDSDGSVYLGSIESSTRNASTLNFKREVLAQSAKLAGETKSVNQTGQMFRFRVAGTNLTLNQPMVFTGNILNNVAPGSNAPASNAPASNGGAFAPAGQVSPRLDQSQLSGQVLLGLTNRIDILAVPAKQ